MSECHLCGADLAEAPVVGTSTRSGKPSRRVACVACGLVQVDPQPPADELQHYYETDYHSDHGPVTLAVTRQFEDGRVHTTYVPSHSAGYEIAIDNMHKSRAQRVVRDLGLEPGMSVLEVGCSDGRTALELERLGMRVDGVEPDPERSGQAHRRINGVVFCGELREFYETDFRWPTADGPPEDEKYDAVVAFHVLEHFPKPLEALGLMRDMLKPDGQVWVEVPDVMRPSLPLTEHWQWVHLYDFSEHTLWATLREAGFAPEVNDPREGALCAWGRRAAPPRHDSWVDNVRGGAEVAAHLASLPQQAPTGDVFKRWLGGESVTELGDVKAVEQHLRQEIAAWRDGVERMQKAWDDVAHLVGTTGNKLGEQAFPLFDSWDPDPFQYGFAMGRAEAMMRSKDLLVTVANAMKRKEACDG